MKILLSLILFSLLLSGSPACKEVKKSNEPPGINVMIQDLPCEEVLDRIQKKLKKQSWPFSWTDTDQGLLSIGPLTSPPLPDDPFRQVEEKIHLEIKCRAPLSTRLSLRMEAKGFTLDGRWVEIKEPVKLNAYGKRFLEKLNLP
jgi:hypothetical protein